MALRSQQRQSHNEGTAAVTRMVQTTTSVYRTLDVEQPTRKKLVFGWIQDVSGSMAGGRIQSSLAGLDYMCSEVFQPTDFLGVMTYNGEVRTLHSPMPVKKVDIARDKIAIEAGLRGQAAYDRMYDSIGTCITSLQAMAQSDEYRAATEDAVYEILLLTYGGDNYSSQYTLRQAAELVAHPGLPNFHFIIVAVSMSESDKKKLRVLCTPDHATFLEVSELRDLKRALKGVGKGIQRRLEVTTTVSVTREIRSHAHDQGDQGLSGITDGFKGCCVSLAPRILPPSLPPATHRDKTIRQSGRSRVSPRGSSSSSVPATRRDVRPPREVDRRREAVAQCSFFAQGRCSRGESCRFLHY